MKPFFKDINQSLEKVERKWVRRPVTILFIPIVIVGGAIFGSYDFIRDWIKKCW